MFDDVEYHCAYRVVCRFLQICSPVPRGWGIFLYSFSLADDEGATSGPSGREASGSSIETLVSPAHTGGMLPDVGNILSGVRL